MVRTLQQVAHRATEPAAGPVRWRDNEGLHPAFLPKAVTACEPVSMRDHGFNGVPRERPGAVLAPEAGDGRKARQPQGELSMLNSCSANVTSVTSARPGAAGEAVPLPGTVAAMLAAMAEAQRAEQRLVDAADAAGLPKLPGSMIATLLRLAAAPRALSSAEIQRSGLYAGSNFSYGLNAMVTAGLLWTTPHPTDGRRTMVTVSAAGRRAVAAILAELEG